MHFSHNLKPFCPLNKIEIVLFDNQIIIFHIPSQMTFNMVKTNKGITYYILLFTIGVLLTSACQSGNSNADDQISEDILAKDAYQMIQENIGNEDFVILDTRTTGEYSRGHIQNTVFVDFSSSSFKGEIEKLDRNKKYIIYCHSGARSKTTLNLMKKLGFKEAYNMIGGIVAWSKAGYELVK